MQATLVTVTKFDAMRRQLDTAIDLWFADADPIAIHTLASASHEILDKLYRKKGLKHLLFDGHLVADEYKNKWETTVKQNYNFFKHASKDPNQAIRFNPSTNEFLFFFSIIGLGRMKIDLTMIENAFIFWFLVNRPRFVQKGAYDDAKIESIENLRGLPKQEFLLNYATQWMAVRST